MSGGIVSPPSFPPLYRVCPSCRHYRVTREDRLRTHMDICRGRRVPCYDCGLCFASGESLGIHRFVGCSPQVSSGYWENFFRRLDSWAAHSYVAPYRYFCVICGNYSHRDLSRMRDHLRQCLTSFSEASRRGRCAMCGLSVSDMRRHAVFACSKRKGPYYCPFCGVPFGKKSEFCNHILDDVRRILFGGVVSRSGLPLNHVTTSRHLPVPLDFPGISRREVFRALCPSCHECELEDFMYYCRHIFYCDQVRADALTPVYHSRGLWLVPNMVVSNI